MASILWMFPFSSLWKRVLTIQMVLLFEIGTVIMRFKSRPPEQFFCIGCCYCSYLLQNFLWPHIFLYLLPNFRLLFLLKLQVRWNLFFVMICKSLSSVPKCSNFLFFLKEIKKLQFCSIICICWIELSFERHLKL